MKVVSLIVLIVVILALGSEAVSMKHRLRSKVQPVRNEAVNPASGNEGSAGEAAAPAASESSESSENAAEKPAESSDNAENSEASGIVQPKVAPEVSPTANYKNDGLFETMQKIKKAEKDAGIKPPTPKKKCNKPADNDTGAAERKKEEEAKLKESAKAVKALDGASANEREEAKKEDDKNKKDTDKDVKDEKKQKDLKEVRVCVGLEALFFIFFF